MHTNASQCLVVLTPIVTEILQKEQHPRVQDIYSINLDFTVNPFMEPPLTSMSTSRIARCTWVVNKSCRLEDDDCFLLLQKIV